MSLIIDRKYISVVSTKLRNFKQKKDYLWNFSCPLCGDSKKHKTKTRGYFYRVKSNPNMSFICHNCGSGMSFGNFLKGFDNNIYRQYQMERFKEESHSNTPKPDFTLFKTQPVFTKSNSLSIPCITTLNSDHSAVKYIASRKIPKDKWDNIYYADDFLKFCDDTFPNHGKKLIKEEPRIVIPFYNKDNELIGIQGRSLDPKAKVRYITIKVNDEVTKIYGLNKVDFSQTIYVVEGPFDSMFLDNSIASMDASLYSVVLMVGADKDYVLIFDREPRNREICKHIEKAINLGYHICLLPESLSGKDINEYIMNGTSREDLFSLIKKYTFQGIRAKLEFVQWKKIT